MLSCKHLEWRLAAFTAFVIPAAGFASAFGLIQQSALSGGTAHAGSGVLYEDAAIAYYNPAGMVWSEGSALSLAGHYNAPSYEFSGIAYDEKGALDLGQRTNINSAKSVFNPAFYYTRKLSSDWAIGLAINGPFGMVMHYPTGWGGRYDAVDTDIKIVNINPSFAYRINDNVSIGAGLGLQYAEVDLSQQIKAPLVNVSVVTVKPEGDIFGRKKGDSLAATFNLGVLWRVNDELDLGLTYRHVAKHKIKGTVTGKGQVVADVPFVGKHDVPVDVRESGHARMETPESVTLSAAFRPEAAPRWRVLGDIEYVRWSRLQVIDVETNRPLQVTVPDTVPILGGRKITQDPVSITMLMNDTWRFSVGTTWDYSEKLQLRAGMALHEGAVNDARRSARVPDSNRTWYSLGAGYRLSDALRADVSYSRIQLKNASVNRTKHHDEPANRSTTLEGTFKSSADVFGLQLTWQF